MCTAILVKLNILHNPLLLVLLFQWWSLQSSCVSERVPVWRHGAPPAGPVRGSPDVGGDDRRRSGQGKRLNRLVYQFIDYITTLLLHYYYITLLTRF